MKVSTGYSKEGLAGESEWGGIELGVPGVVWTVEGFAGKTE